MAIQTPTPTPAPTTPAAPVVVREEVRYERVYVWQWPIRLFHWTVAAAVTVLFATGLLIAYPQWSGSGEPFEVFTMGRVRQVHFVAGYVFAISLAWRAVWFLIGNRYARSGFPFFWKKAWWRAVTHQGWRYLCLDCGKPHLGHNALAGLSYVLFVFGLGAFEIATGFALLGESNPGGFLDSTFGWVIPLIGGSARAHIWHHLAAWGFLVFVILHVYIVMLDAREYRNGILISMITGHKFRREDAEGDDGLM